MKTVKMIEVYNSVSVMNTLLEMKMPVKTSIKLLALIQELNNSLKEAEKIRSELVEKYGKKDKSGSVSVPESKKKEFIDELNEVLFSKDVEIKSPLLSFSDFDPSFQISPTQLSLISYLIQG